MNPKQRVAVVGAGGHGKVILGGVLEANYWDVVAVLDDDPAKAGGKMFGIPVAWLGDGIAAAAEKLGFREIFLGIGDNYNRARKFQEAVEGGVNPATFIHPHARVSRFAELGKAVVIMAGAVIQPGAVIEEDVCVNTSACVDHDDFLARHSHVFPNSTLGGGVRVGEFSYIGAGAVVKPYTTVGNYAFVGAGAVVLQDVPEGAVVAGVPARYIQTQDRRPHS